MDIFNEEGWGILLRLAYHTNIFLPTKPPTIFINSKFRPHYIRVNYKYVRLSYKYRQYRDNGIVFVMKPLRGQERNPTEEKCENTILDRIYIFFTFAILLVIL